MSVFYRDKNKIEFQVGLFAIIGSIILIAGYFWLNDMFMSRHYNSYQVHFEHANGLEPGDPVKLYGLKVGKVNKLSIGKNGIIADVMVDNKYPVTWDTEFWNQDSGIMKGHEIEIIQGSSGKGINPKTLISGHTRKGFGQLVNKASVIADKFEDMMNDLSGDKGLLTKLENIGSNTEDIAKALKIFWSENEGSIEKTISNISELTVMLKTITADNKDEFYSIVDSLSANLSEMKTLIVKVGDLTDTVSSISTKIDSGDNSISNMINDKEMYDSMFRSVNSLDSLVKDIKKNPKKYLKFSVF